MLLNGSHATMARNYLLTTQISKTGATSSGGLPPKTPSLLLDDLGYHRTRKTSYKRQETECRQAETLAPAIPTKKIAVCTWSKIYYNSPSIQKKTKKGSCPEPLCMLNFGMKQFGGEIKSSLVVARVSSRP